MYFNQSIKGISIALLLLSVSPAAWTQAVSVIGGGSSARECYLAAQIAAQLQSASRSEIEDCDLALEHGNLSLRDLAATYVNRGVLHVAVSEYEAAARDYRRAMELQPNFGAIYVNRGNLFFMAEIYQKAIDEYTKALGMNLSLSHVAHLNRGMAYERLGKYPAAETDYRRALEIAPEWSVATSKLERVLSKMKKQSAASQNG